MRTMLRTCRIAALTLLVSVPAMLQAQYTGHYLGGTEGIKGGSLPPPGFYTRDYNVFYWSDRLADPQGAKVPVDFSLTVYAQVFRNIWMSDFKILGANYGCDVILPFLYTDVKAGPAKDHSFQFWDLAVEPLLLSWQYKQFDLGVGYAFWAPTGEFDLTRPAKSGKGFWSNMLTLGATWYPTEDKMWAVTALNRYEFHTENSKVKVTPGDSYTLEWGLSRSLRKTVDVGVIGYYQQQVTEDSGTGVPAGPRNLDRVFAVGPEISVLCPKLMLFVSARYAHEFGARDRTEGDVFNLTLTKRW